MTQGSLIWDRPVSSGTDQSDLGQASLICDRSVSYGKSSLMWDIAISGDTKQCLIWEITVSFRTKTTLWDRAVSCEKESLI